MRHKKSGRRLGRNSSHRKAMFRNMAASILKHETIKTTLPKARELRPIVEKLVTLGKKNTLHSRRRAISLLGSNQLAQRSVKVLFDEIATASADRQGGYTRIIKLGQRRSDSAAMALIEFVDIAVPAGEDDES